ncbi:MAG: tetratricopeptide repeat protein [Thermodesulfobacteriota bacterium]|nr:tetratricopeptide repeat protein [Thermodesulfobacteriota bacterium]
MNNLYTYIRAPILVLIISSFMLALFSVNWSLSDLFLTPDQQGRLLMAKDDFTAAAKSFEEPMQRGTALYRSGDFKAAAAAFGRDDSVEALYNRSNSQLMSGKYDAAIAGYEKALSLKPDWLVAEENLALARARKEKMAPPDDDAGGTGGQLEADEIVFDKRAASASSEQTETIQGGDQVSDQEMRAMWLRRVQTKPADFLRAKFSYQYVMVREAAETK